MSPGKTRDKSQKWKMSHQKKNTVVFTWCPKEFGLNKGKKRNIGLFGAQTSAQIFLLNFEHYSKRVF